MSAIDNRIAIILILVTAAAIAGTFLLADPVPQWPEYHDFADSRSFFGIPNTHNVLSNIGLLITGTWGVLFVLGRSGRTATGKASVPWFVFFLGVLLTAFGSAWYHLDPGNQTLAWDRLSMTIMFAGLLAAMIGELICPRAARALLLPLLATGIASVLWWAWTESLGAGDLRPYALMQFLPGLLILLMLLMYPKPAKYLPYVTGMIGFLILAKLSEQFDHQIYQALGSLVAGHALKHLFAAAAVACLLLMLYQRRNAES